MAFERISERLSRVLAETIDAVTVRKVLASFGREALTLLVVLLLLPNAFLAPPVLAGISVGPVALFGVQLLLDREEPWLPQSLLDKAIPKAAIERLMARAGPVLDRLEARSRARLPILTGSIGRRVFGLFAVLAAAIVILPIPGTNVLPAIGIMLMGMGLIARDGLLVLIGILCSISGLAVAFAAAGLVLQAIDWLVRA
ncbi:exopolysaccharide biosynthesis protein [Microvirga massiliensis]|uniref:exopolysaccharide biosynthesis protein n=1 Tax=Microvirga massiliensis TaxID=1033741 RepID=UPI00062BE1FF|nr:exopolysaccharide biosynthesis protein [Microvirga massiliensis]